MNDFNFFSIYQKKRGLDLNPGSPYFISGIIVLVCVALTAGIFIYNLILSRQIEAANSETIQIKASQEYTEASYYQNSLQAMSNYEAGADHALLKFQASNVIRTELLEAIWKGLPVNVRMTSFTIDQTTINMSFQIPNRRAAAELLKGLKETGLFQEIHLGAIGAGTDTPTMSTTVTGTLKAGEAK